MTAWLVVLLATTAHTRRNSGCYETALRKDPAAKGKVVVTFTFEKDGAVKQAEMKEDDIGNARLASCIVSAMKSLVFPAPKGGGVVSVSYPDGSRTPERRLSSM